MKKRNGHVVWREGTYGLIERVAGGLIEEWLTYSDDMRDVLPETETLLELRPVNDGEGPQGAVYEITWVTW